MSNLAGQTAQAPAPVGYVAKMFPRLSETFILNEVLELGLQGVPLHVFSLKEPADTVSHAQTAQVRARVTYVPERPGLAPIRLARAHWHVWRRHGRQWRRSLRNALRRSRSHGDPGDLLAFYQACCIIREMGGIRHLHAHYANVPAKVALLVHRISGASYSITTHAKDIFQNDPFASPKLRERMLRASFVVANSRFSAEHIRRGLNGAGEIHVVYNGLDLGAFPLRQDEPKEPVILGVGRLVEKKGFQVLVAACELLRKRGVKFVCEIVGTGVLSTQLKEQIRATGLGDRVKLVGPLPQHVLKEHYTRALVFALPCVAAANGDRDILPNAVKEAMATGVPVITTALDGIEELVEDGSSGLLVQPVDASALASGLELLLANAELRRRLAGRARHTVEQRFDRRLTVSGLKTLLEKAAARSPAVQMAGTEAKLSTAYDASCLR